MIWSVTGKQGELGLVVEEQDPVTAHQVLDQVS